jgi:hypothetical protein
MQTRDWCHKEKQDEKCPVHGANLAKHGLFLQTTYWLIPITGRNGTIAAKEFWWMARRKSDGYLQVTRAMTTLLNAKRTSRRVSFLMVIGKSN